MSAFETIICLVLALWLIANIMYALFNRRAARYTHRFDPFRWISAYQLFAEPPRVFKLYYRDKTVDDITSDWHNIPLSTPYSWYHAVWFPEALVTKNIQSTVDDLARFIDTEKNNTSLKKVSERFIYKIVISFTQRFPGFDSTKERQFKIEETTREGSLREVFTSGFHKNDIF